MCQAAKALGGRGLSGRIFSQTLRGRGVHDRGSCFGPDLHLVLDGVRLTRGWQDDGWFPNVVFHDTAHPNEQYALEVWRVPEGDRLKPMDIGFLFRQAQPTRQLG
jgi:hypothetical protein